MKFLKELLKKNWASYTIATCSAVILYLGLTNINRLFGVLSAIYTIAIPIVSAVIISYVLNPVVIFFQDSLFKKVKSRKLARKLGVSTTVIIVVALIALLIGALIPQIVGSMISFGENFETYASSFRKMAFRTMNESTIGNSIYASIDDLWLQFISKISETLSDNMGNIIGTSFSIGKGFFTGIIACILAIYFLIDAPHLMENCGKLIRIFMSERNYKDFTGFIRKCNHILLRYILCDIVEGLIVGIVNFIFMSILGMDYAVLISVVVGVTNLAPTFGPIFGGAVGAFILVLVNPWHALWFLVFTVVLQTIDGYIIKPKLFGDTLGVSPVWILIMLIIGGRILGVAGLLLAIPIAAIGDFVFKDIIWKKLEAWKKEREEKNSK